MTKKNLIFFAIKLLISFVIIFLSVDFIYKVLFELDNTFIVMITTIPFAIFIALLVLIIWNFISFIEKLLEGVSK